MEEKVKVNTEPAGAQEERTYTQSQVDAILGQARIQLDSMKKELQRRDLTNFYQTLSVLFEIIRNREAYAEDFVKKCVDTVQGSLENLFATDVFTTEENKDE